MFTKVLNCSSTRKLIYGEYMAIFDGFQWWTYLALFGAGLFSGAISPTFGIGGGLVNVPILLIAFSSLLGDNPGATATATSLGVIVFTALSGSLSYIREKRIDFRIALIFMIFAIPGAISGAIFANWVREQDFDLDVFQIIFAATMIAIAIYKIVMIIIQRNKNNELSSEEIAKNEEIKEQNLSLPWWKQTVIFREKTDKRGVHFKYKAKLIPGIFIAAIGGFLGATLGLGGGVIYMPILTMAIGVPAAIASATSTFTILFATPFALTIRAVLGAHIRWGIVICMAVGTIISANIVPRFLHKIQSEWILAGFWIIAILAALRIMLKVLNIINF